MKQYTTALFHLQTLAHELSLGEGKPELNNVSN